MSKQPRHSQRQYEMNVDALRQRRKDEHGIQHKNLPSDYSILRRLHFIYKVCCCACSPLTHHSEHFRSSRVTLLFGHSISTFVRSKAVPKCCQELLVRLFKCIQEMKVKLRADACSTETFFRALD